MNNLIQLAIGISALALGYPLGYFLASITKEELPLGQRWFKLIITTSLAGAFASFLLRNDALFFSFLFFAVVTSASLKRNKKYKEK